MVRRSASLLSCALIAVVTMTGCHGHNPAVRSAARQSAAPTTSAAASAPSAPAGVIVGVIRKSGPLAIYRIGRDRHARPVAEFITPHPGERVSSVSLSSGAEPRACATWAHLDEDRLATGRATMVCYSLDSTHKATPITGIAGNPASVALSADGREIAWTDYTRENNETDVVFGSLVGNRIVSTHRVLPGPSMQCRPCLDNISGVAWSGDHALMLSRQGQDDEGAGLGRLPLDARHIASGWRDGPRSMDAWKTDPAYKYFDYVGSANLHSALAIERPSWNGPPPRGIRERAVLVDLATGRRVATLATALPGRDVTSVSGGAAGIVYRTEGNGPQARYYLRLPGDAAGQPITGLPSDTVYVVAQPS